MVELFAIGTFWFWALVVAEITLLFIFVEYENGIGATISLAVFGALLQWFGGVDLVSYAKEHPIYLAGALLSYFVFGMVWGIIKWRWFCIDLKNEFKEIREEWLRGHGSDDVNNVPDTLRKDWDSYMNTHYYRGDNNPAQVPSVKQNKARITRWMSFWPVSFTWSLFDDVVKRIFWEIYNKIAKFLQRMADDIYSDVKTDLPKRYGKDAAQGHGCPSF